MSHIPPLPTPPTKLLPTSPPRIGTGLGSFVVTAGKLVVSDMTTNESIPCVTNGTWHVFAERVSIGPHGMQTASLTLLHDSMLNEPAESYYDWTKNYLQGQSYCDIYISRQWNFSSIGIFDTDRFPYKDRSNQSWNKFKTRWVSALTDDIAKGHSPVGRVVEVGVVAPTMDGRGHFAVDVVKGSYDQVVAVHIDLAMNITRLEREKLDAFRKREVEGGGKGALSRKPILAFIRARMQGARPWARHTLIECFCPGYIHRKDEYEEGSFCPRCARAEAVKRGLDENDTKPENEGPDDHIVRCDSCDRRLSLSLTRYGAARELTHWESSEAYESALLNSPDRWRDFYMCAKYVSRKNLPRVVAILSTHGYAT